MPQIRPISLKELVRRLREFDFKGPFPGGKHQFMIKDSIRLTIPNLHREEISIDLLIRILKQANITKEEWLNK